MRGAMLMRARKGLYHIVVYFVKEKLPLPPSLWSMGKGFSGPGRDYFSEEKRHAHFAASNRLEEVPAYRLVNTCKQGRYRVEKEVLVDPRREGYCKKPALTRPG